MQEIRFKQSGVPVGKLFMNFMACSGPGHTVNCSLRVRSTCS